MKRSNGEFSNIPNARMRRLANRFRELQTQIATARQESEEIREEAIKILGLGRYDMLTVYSVAETKVSGYTRGAYKAIRARLPA